MRFESGAFPVGDIDGATTAIIRPGERAVQLRDFFGAVLVVEVGIDLVRVGDSGSDFDDGAAELLADVAADADGFAAVDDIGFVSVGRTDHGDVGFVKAIGGLMVVSHFKDAVGTLDRPNASDIRPVGIKASKGDEIIHGIPGSARRHGENFAAQTGPQDDVASGHFLVQDVFDGAARLIGLVADFVAGAGN